MRRIAILCGLCLLMTGAAASGAPLIGSLGNSSPSREASATGLIARRLAQEARVTASTQANGAARHATLNPARWRHSGHAVLLGEPAIEPAINHNLVGTVEAFPFRAKLRGTAASINVYLDARDRATSLFAGLYSNTHGHPQSLLTAGLLRSPKPGRWNSVRVGAVTLRSGGSYWLAVLGTGGAIYFRARNGGSCTGGQSSKRKTGSLPARWSAGPHVQVCLISAYVKGNRGTSTGRTKVFGVNVPAGTSPTTNGTPAATPTDNGPATPGTPLTLPPAPTSAPTIAGSPAVGQTITTSDGAWIDNPTSYSYQWEDCNTIGLLCTNIGGATASSYAVGNSDVGHTIRAVVTAANVGGSGSATSAPTGVVTRPAAPANSTPPAISGRAVQGQILTTTNGTWTNSPTSYVYQWEDCNSSGLSCAGISGATSREYTLGAGDVGYTIRVSVTATNAGGSSSAPSPQTAVVTAPVAPSNTGAPVVSGTAQEGDVLATTNGSWSGGPTAYSYQWQDCDSSGGSCSSIGGATSSSYTLQAADVGKTVRSEVTACNGASNQYCSSPAGSAVTGVVAASGGGDGGSIPANTVAPYFAASTVSSSGACSAGCAIVGEQLSVTPGSWSSSPSSYSYQWQDCTTSPGTSTGVPVVSGAGYVMTLPSTGSCSNAAGAGATSSTYTVAASDVGKALAVQVTATNGAGSASTTWSGACDTGLMSTQMPATENLSQPPASGYFDNGEPGCSPISAVVGTGQDGSGTSGEHFCTNAPVTCGFADIATAGVPAGTTLYAVPGTCTSPSGPGAGCGNTGSGWSYSSGALHLTSGATLKDVSYQGSIGVSGVSNVTIEDSDLMDYGANNYVVLLHGASNVTIEHNDITGKDATTVGDGCDDAIRDSSGNSTNVTIVNNNMWYCAAVLNNFINGGWTIANNYIHDFAFAASGNHEDGIQFEGNANANTAATPFYNNTLLMDFRQTAPVILSNDSNAANTNRQIVHNLLAGGDYCLYIAGTSTYPTVNSTFSGNVFSSIYYGMNRTGSADQCSAYYDGVDYWTANTNTWSNNTWDDNGTALSP